MVYPADHIRRRGLRIAIGCAPLALRETLANARLVTAAAIARDRRRPCAHPVAPRTFAHPPTQVSQANKTKRGLYVYEA